MRLIDADALNLDYEVDMADDWKTAHEIANVVKYAPTIDAVEVVRCKDCKWWDKYSDTHGYCMAAKHGHWSAHWDIQIRRTYEGDFFCADGERKDGEADDSN